MIDAKNILDAADCGAMVLDNELNIQLWNGWLQTATNISKDKAVSKKLYDIVDIDLARLDTLKRNIKTSLAMGIMTFMTPSAHGYLVKISIKNPFLTSFENMQQEVKIVPLDRDKGIVCIFIADHTAVMDSQRALRLEQQKLQELVEIETAKRLDQERLLIQQSRLALLGEMIAAISHQMRQPLSAIKMLASDIKFLSLTGELDPTQVDADASMIQAQVEYMNNTIVSFRNFLMPSKGNNIFDVTSAIQDVAKLLSTILKELNVELLLEVGGTTGSLADKVFTEKLEEHGQIVVFGCETEFKQVLVNLISNTKDALEELKKSENGCVGTVIIQVLKSENGNVTLRYRDNAGGIPNHILPKMFEPYTTSKGENGTGIGMYMSKQIVDKMGGSIKVANISGGAMFTIELKGCNDSNA